MMKKSYALWMVILLGIASSALGAEGWLTDFEKAKKMAAEKNLPILAEFAGLDWCPPCIALGENVFSTEVFKKYAKENVVLFLADFPRTKPQGPVLVKQNEKLSEQYGVQTLPTVLLLKADGTIIDRTGYRRGGAEAYIKHIKELLK